MPQMEIANQYLKTLVKNKLFDGLRQEEAADALSKLALRVDDFARGGGIVAQGEPAKDLGVILSGAAVSWIEGLGKPPMVLDFFSPQEIICLPFASPKETIAPFGVKGVSRGKVLWLGFGKLDPGYAGKDKIAQDSHVRILFNLHTLSRHNAIRDAKGRYLLASYSVRDRLLCYLLTVSESFGANEFTVAMGQTELAEFLSVSRQNLSSELNRLRREGVIDYNATDHLYTIKKNPEDYLSES